MFIRQYFPNWAADELKIIPKGSTAHTSQIPAFFLHLFFLPAAISVTPRCVHWPDKHSPPLIYQELLGNAFMNKETSCKCKFFTPLLSWMLPAAEFGVKEPLPIIAPDEYQRERTKPSQLLGSDPSGTICDPQPAPVGHPSINSTPQQLHRNHSTRSRARPGGVPGAAPLEQQKLCWSSPRSEFVFKSLSLLGFFSGLHQKWNKSWKNCPGQG